jgi:hypothetical protein
LAVWNNFAGIDYTISNTGAGKRTFGGKSLHSLHQDYMNPYQHVISVLSRTLAVCPVPLPLLKVQPFDDDGLIPVFGFGDKTTTDKKVFPFLPDGGSCQGADSVLRRYGEITPYIQLAGPTSFAPLIKFVLPIR